MKNKPAPPEPIPAEYPPVSHPVPTQKPTPYESGLYYDGIEDENWFWKYCLPFVFVSIMLILVLGALKII